MQSKCQFSLNQNADHPMTCFRYKESPMAMRNLHAIDFKQQDEFVVLGFLSP